MGFYDEYMELRKKRLNGEETPAKMEDLAPPRLLYQNKTLALNNTSNNDIAPVKQTTEDDDRKWFQKGAFADGYQFGDIFKTIEGSARDLQENIYAGVLGIGEAVVDAGAYIVGGVGGLFGADEFKDDMKDFIASDLYDEKAVARKLLNATTINWFGDDDIADTASVFGDKTDSLAQSGGQLLSTVALQAAGVPWYVTTGVTGFGGASEEAMQQDATYGEAGLYATVSAGAEMLTEKLFKGSGLGEKGIVNLDLFTKGISNKIVKSLASYGVDMAAEGAEEVVSQAINNMATSIYNDGNAMDLLTNEEAIDSYIESFIGGAVLGGAANVGKVSSSIKTGKDYNTGLTSNEQKVFDKVYEERIAEEEKGGTKLTSKEKDKIYDEVMEDIERGNISIDKIESALGGDTYTSYQDAVKKENALKQEYAKLNKLKQSDMTGEQMDRRAELKQLLADLKTNAQSAQLKTQLSQSVAEMAKSDRLVESYNEKARRSQAFTADITKYDAKQQKVIENAVKSGILNNTNKTHEFVDMVAKISADKGVSFDFTNNAKLKKSSFAVDGATVNGYVTKDGVTVNIDSRKSLNSVVGHEITHVLEGTELYTALQSAVIEYAKTKGDYQGRYASLAKLYKDVKDANVDAELTADLVGDYLFTDSDFINHLSAKNRNVFQKIYDEIKYLWKIATAGSKEKRELEKVKRAFEDAYRNNGKNEIGAAKYDVSIDKNSQKWYNNTKWASDSGLLNAGQMDNFYSEFAAITANLESAKDRMTKSGEYMVPVSDIYDNSKEGIQNVIVYAKGTLDDAVITAVLEIDADNETKLSDIRRQVYETERRGIQQKTEGIFRRYDPSDFKNARIGQSGLLRGDGHHNRLGAERGASGRKTSGAVSYRTTKEGHKVYDLTPNETSSKDGVFFDGKETKFSLSDSDGKKLTKEQSDYFKDSKMRDDNGNLKVMYHGSQDAGFHVFDPVHSDDETSLFFVDRNDVAASYSGTTETYEARTIRTADDMNKFLAEIGYDQYQAVKRNGKYELLENGDHVATKNTAQEIYEEFCWYEGVGEGDANYKVYLNLKNPLVVDAEGRNWNNVSREFSQELADKYNSLTAEEKDALLQLASWEDYGIFKDEMLEARAAAEQGVAGGFGDATFTKLLARAYEKLGGANTNLYDAFSIASDNFSEDSIKQYAVKQMNTRDYAKKAKAEGYDGVIFKNIVDVGGYGNGSEGASTVAVAFDSNQVKSVANENPTRNADIRYSLSEADNTYLEAVERGDTETAQRMVDEAASKAMPNSLVKDDNGNLLTVYHGSPNKFTVFKHNRMNVNGNAHGRGFYFTENKNLAEGYERDGGQLLKGYLNIEKPLSEEKVTIKRTDLVKLIKATCEEQAKTLVADDGYGSVKEALPDTWVSNYVMTYGMNMNDVYREVANIVYAGSDNDVDIIAELTNGGAGKETTLQLTHDILGYDGVIYTNTDGYHEFVSLISNQFKSSETVTYDDDGNVIPLSERFNDGKTDIRYSLSENGEIPKKYGNFNISGDDVRLEKAPAKVDVSKKETTPKAVAPVKATVSKKEQVADVVPNEIAPIHNERIVGVESELYNLKNEQSTLEKRIEKAVDTGDHKTGVPLIEKHTALQGKINQAEAERTTLNRDRIASLTDADVPPVMEAPYSENSVTPADPFDERDIKAVGNRTVKAYMYENPEVKPFFQKEANILLGELQGTQKGERYYTEVEGGVPMQYGAESYGVWSGVSRQTTPDIEYLLDSLKMSYADIEKGLNAIIEDNGAENIAAAKKIEFVLNDRLMKGYVDSSGYDIPADQDYINLLNEKQITEYTEEARKSFFEVADRFAPPEDIAPVAEKYEAIKPKKETSNEPKLKRVKEGEVSAPTATYETTKKSQVSGQRTMFAEDKTANILVDEPETAKKKVSGWSKFRTNFLDKQSVFEDLALKTKNRELMGKANFMLSSEARAQRMIGNGRNGVKALNDIRKEVESAGLTEQFYNYMHHAHNADRMSLERKATPKIQELRGKFANLKIEQVKAIAAKKITDKTTEQTAATIREAKEYLNALETKNKPVFGDSVTAEVSRETMAKLEAEHPEFKKWAQECYDYNNYLRKMLVDSGVISQETADLWQELYPHYIPIRRAGKSGLGVTVPLDTNKTGVNAPIKRATGGNSDILPMFDTMAMRTEQTFKAIAKNSFGVELKNTLGTTIDSTATNVDEVIDSVDNHEELLQKGKNGEKPTFTVFEDGKRVTYEITEEMYDALKPTSDGLKYTNKALGAISNAQRGLLTEYNPVFMATNAMKDAQDILINSQHPAKTYANIPSAIKEISKGGKWYQEYLDNGGEQNTYFDGQNNTFKAEDKGFKKIIGMPLRAISRANNIIERVPRLAEYIASRKNGASVEVAMLDAGRVSTNFAAGGDVTKFVNRNGATFLNASVQGFNQQVRNIREAKANGLKGWMQLATKVAVAGIPAMILNNLLWEDDEEYEELSDYVKQNYYVVAKFGDGKFVRIPKGRTLAVIQNALEQTVNLATGNDEFDLNSFLELAISNLAPNNPLDNNILAPIMQVANNETWYGEDLVPTRLQDLPEAEQYDESTDAISKWLGETFDYSPYKINYLLDQYSGGIGDVLLPMLTPEAESGDNSIIGNIFAPFKDKFTTDSTMNNQNVSDFYDTVDELTANAKSSYATDEDVLKYKYMNSIRSDIGELYAQKREIQSSDLSDEEKYAAVREIQEQINALSKDSLDTYKDVYIDDGYATIGNLHFRMNDKGEWTKLTEEQLEKQEEVTKGLDIEPSEYWSDKSEYDFAYEYPEKYEFLNKNGVTYDDYKNGSEEFKEAYTWAYNNPEKFTVSKAIAGDVVVYRQYASELYDIKADKDENGKSISGSRKEKVIDYVNNLDIDYGARLILFKNEYNADDTYNEDIIDYLNSREDISYDDMVTILKELGFTVTADGTIYWD